MGSRKQHLRVLVLIDLPWRPAADLDYEAVIRREDCEDVFDVYQALVERRHKVRFLGLFDDVVPLIDELRRCPPDIVFNLIETFNCRRDLGPNVTALLELLTVPFTGASSTGLRLCRDKALTKKVLNYHRIRTPGFQVVERGRPLPDIAGAVGFPSICKPLGLEASEGISQRSLARNEHRCAERIRFIHERLESDAIVEEFIYGREIYVGVIGNRKLTVLPPQELLIGKAPEDVPVIATYRAKWDESYRKRWGITSGTAKNLDRRSIRKLATICKKIYRHFHLSGYARFDFRLDDAGDIVFLEANPNPAIAKDDEFAMAAQAGGMSYGELIERILRLGLAARPNKVKTP